MWFFAATFRARDHLAFDRTRDAAQGLVEFLVPPACEQLFLDCMRWYQEHGMVLDLHKEDSESPTH